jgi:hypothetical protein
LVSDINDEHRLRVSENRMLRKIYGPKRIETVRGCRELHSVEHYQDDEIVRICSTHGREAKCIQAFGRKTRMNETTRKT